MSASRFLLDRAMEEWSRTGSRPGRYLMEIFVRRGDIYSVRLPKGGGHEQLGKRFGVVVQSGAFLPRSVVLIAPTSISARPASFRPEVDIEGTATKVLVEQLGAVDVTRLGEFAVT